MKISAVGVAKFVVSGLVGIGTGKIVAKIIKDHITPETLIDKVTITAAAWVIGAIATEATKTYTNEMVDQVVESVTTVVDKYKTGQKLGRITKGESTFEKEDLDPANFKQDDKNRWVFKDESEDIHEKNLMETLQTKGLSAVKLQKNRAGEWVLVTH